MPTPVNFPHNEVAVMARLTDVSAPSSAFVAASTSGFLARAYSCLQGPITVADCTWQVKINGSAVAGTGTIAQSGSAAGDVDIVQYAVPIWVAAGSTIEFASAGESTTTAACEFTAVLRT